MSKKHSVEKTPVILNLPVGEFYVQNGSFNTSLGKFTIKKRKDASATIRTAYQDLSR